MGRRLKLQIRTNKAAYDEACRTAGAAFAERRFQDAVGTYEQFAKDHPDAHCNEIELRISALRSYIADHVERLKN